MEKLDNQAAIDTLCQRFGNFHDAILVEVVLHLPRQSRDRFAELRLVAEDTEGNWCSVRFVVSSLRGHKFEEGRTSHLVLSDGLRIVLCDGSTFIDLAPYSDHVSEDTLRLSYQYVVGGECQYEIDAAEF
jgi:hypothetical protein